MTTENDAGKPSQSSRLLADLQVELHRVTTAHVQTQFILAYFLTCKESDWPKTRNLIDKMLKGQDLNAVLKEASELSANDKA